MTSLATTQGTRRRHMVRCRHTALSTPQRCPTSGAHKHSRLCLFVLLQENDPQDFGRHNDARSPRHAYFDADPAPSHSASKDVNRGPERWFQLLVLGSMAFCNAWMWMTFVPIRQEAEIYYRAYEPSIDLLQDYQLFSAIPMYLVVAWLLDAKGLRVGVTIGAYMQALGAMLRVTPNFTLLCIGQFLVCAASPIFVVAAAKIATSWFNLAERTLATALCIFAYFSGVGAAYIVGPSVVGHHGSIGALMLLMALSSCATALVTVIFFKDGDGLVEQPPLSQTVAHLAVMPAFLSLWLVFSLHVSSSGLLLVRMHQIMAPLGYSAEHARLWAELMLLAGLLASIVWSAHVDRSRAFKPVLQALLFLTAVSFPLLTLATFGAAAWAIAVTAAVVGVCAIGAIPIGLQLAVQTCRAPEGAVASFLMLGVSLCALLLHFALLHTNSVELLGICSAMSIVAAAVSFRIHPPLRHTLPALAAVL